MHVTLVDTATVAVHPVAVNVASLAIVMMWLNGSNASFLVQVDKVSTYECYNISIGIV